MDLSDDDCYCFPKVDYGVRLSVTKFVQVRWKVCRGAQI